MTSLVPEHDQVEDIQYVEHYPEHEKRVESALFKLTKKNMHKHGVKCAIDNGKCFGHIEIHHNILEWAERNAVNWKVVQLDYPWFSDVDQEGQMQGLCEKHHRWVAFGKHKVPEPIHKMQRYMKKEDMDKWEREIYDTIYAKDPRYLWDSVRKAVIRKPKEEE